MTRLPRVEISGEPIAPQISVKVGDSCNWNIPSETPVAFVYDQRNYAVMLATPDDLVDFAIGFSLSERIVNGVEDVHMLHVRREARGIELRMTIDTICRERLDVRQSRRNLVGRTGCGVCGLDNAEALFAPLPLVRHAPISIPDLILGRAARQLETRQPLNLSTRSVHAAAWANLHGDIVTVREDVGRHNALDKLVGALACNANREAPGFLVVSSRCSYEIVEKAARYGAPAILSLSAPTALAISRAADCNLTLYCRQGDAFVRIGERL
jgi:FdhD protein